MCERADPARQRRRRGADPARAGPRRRFLPRRAGPAGGARRGGGDRRSRRTNCRTRLRSRATRGARVRSRGRVKFWRALVQMRSRVQEFRTGFLGKCSPVHFFWGSFDLAVTRFSGRPRRCIRAASASARRRDARSLFARGVQRRLLAGRRPRRLRGFYSYAYPSPAGFADAAVAPAEARFDPQLGEFLLPLTRPHRARPGRHAADFLQSTYEAAANAARWDRAALECEQGEPRRPRLVG